MIIIFYLRSLRPICIRVAVTRSIKLPRHSPTCAPFSSIDQFHATHPPLPPNPSLNPSSGRRCPPGGAEWPAPPRSAGPRAGWCVLSPPPRCYPERPSASSRRRRRRSTARAARCRHRSWGCTRRSGSATSLSSRTSTTASPRSPTACWSSPAPSRRAMASLSTSTSCRCDSNSPLPLSFLYHSIIAMVCECGDGLSTHFDTV
jgi:hypothetical protein